MLVLMEVPYTSSILSEDDGSEGGVGGEDEGRRVYLLGFIVTSQIQVGTCRKEKIVYLLFSRH